MSCWILKLLEIMIALFYLGYIMIFEHFYYTPMSTDSTPYDLKIDLVKNHGDSVFARKVCTIVDSLMFGQTVYALILPMLLVD
jgi:hypothetical protein